MKEINPPAIVAQVEDRLEQIANRIRSRLSRCAQDVMDTGADLIEAKGQVGHGGWLAWIEEEFGWGERSARNFMAVAEQFKSANFADLNFSPSALYALAAPSVPEEARQEALDVAESGDEVTHAVAQEIIERHALPQKRKKLPTVDAGKPGEAITLDRWESMTPLAKQEALATAHKSGKKFNDQGENEGIQWALWSWNPVTGCRHNCPYCYARDIANRFYETKFEPALWPSRLSAPKNTPFPHDKIDVEERPARRLGLGNVFTCSMADLFGRWVPDEWVNLVLDAAREAPQWNFLFLTKFPQRMAEFEFPANAWVGTSVDCQARVANAEKAFRKIKAGVKWLSCEPLIEPLKFTDLGAFDWVVLGGASDSTQTPEWKPPRQWVNAIKAEAERLKVRVYEKPNLYRPLQEYPGFDAPEPMQAPESLRYLPEMK